MIFSAFACATEKNEEQETTTTEEKKDIPDYGIIGNATHSYDKQLANIRPKGELSTEYALYAAKGETEGCQLVVYADSDIKKASLKLVKGEYEGITPRSYILNYTQKIGLHSYTDAAVPYGGNKFEYKKKTTLPFIVEFTVSSDAPAGEYEYRYDFSDGEGNVLLSFDITLHIWNFALPEEKSFQTSVGLDGYYITLLGDEGPTSYEQYYNMLLEHNLSAHTLPFDILSEEADKYLSDPRVTSFVIGLWEAKNWDDEKILSYYGKLKTNPDWLKKAIFYVIDEPTSPEVLAEYNAFCKRVAKLCPEIGVISPFYTNKQQGAGIDQVDVMAENTTLWCPKLCLWDDSQSYDPFLDYTPEKSFAERMESFQKEGDTVWAYVCNDPIDPYSQLFIDTKGVNQRLLFWQHYQRDITGFLYWGTNCWGYYDNYPAINPFETPFNGVTDGDGNEVYGEGFLLYPGNKINMTGPIASVRLKIVRDGIDDIELMYLAESVLGKNKVMEIVNKATSSLTGFTDNDSFAALRQELGDAVDKSTWGENK